jgi:crossover junction endodeoxyribonuclease RuvC
MIVAGIDPGNAGAIVFVKFDTLSFTAKGIFDMPTLKTEGKGKTKKGNTKVHTVLDEAQLLAIFNSDRIDHVFLEKAQSMPGQGAPATFNYACSYATIRGICVGLGIPYTLIHPATWKRVMMKDMDRGKDAAIVRAKQLFPNADIGKKDGRAEALLLAVYGIKENMINIPIVKPKMTMHRVKKLIKKG